jgi:hypothetical protein
VVGTTGKFNSRMKDKLRDDKLAKFAAGKKQLELVEKASWFSR